MTTARRFLTYVLMATFGWTATLAVAGETASRDDDAWIQKRRELRHRKRRIILNNDGCDCLHFPKDLEPTSENFLALRTSPLKGSQVDCVFYCSTSSGFSNFTHDTKVGHLLTRQVPEELGRENRTNITRQLIDRGTDPLRLVLEWCHGNGVECFWSFRMNDTHDGATKPDKEYPLFPKLKAEHPEYLIGEYRKRPRYGAWTAVNYALPEIRDLAFRYIEEVCQKYDVDGFEMDFCRHLSYFPSVAFGAQATDDEREMMTDLLRRVRAMAEREGKRRGRPILIATRVPDSAEYCHAVGLDLERWLDDGLIDILVGGFYMRLNPWRRLVDLGHAHDVAVYAGLSESRVQGDAPPFGRNSPESYRGRALRAWRAGVDGIYLFNYFRPEGAFLREIGEPETLATLDRVYYATVRNRRPDAYLWSGGRLLNLPMVTPLNPLSVPVGHTRTIDLEVGERLTETEAALPEVKLYLQAVGAEVSASLNGRDLGSPERTGVWTAFSVDPTLLKPGLNPVAIRAAPAAPPPEEVGGWNVVYEGSAKPQPPWLGDPKSDDLISEVEEGALRIADRGKYSGDYLYYAYPWNVDPSDETIVEARVRVVSGWNNIILSNGEAYERVALYPDRVALYEGKLGHPMDTTDAFHTYRVVLKGSDIRVFVDGELAIDGTGKLTKPLPGRNDIRFGAANSPSLGEARWQSVKLRFRSAVTRLFDVVLSVTPRR